MKSLKNSNIKHFSGNKVLYGQYDSLIKVMEVGMNYIEDENLKKLYFKLGCLPDDISISFDELMYLWSSSDNCKNLTSEEMRELTKESIRILVNKNLIQIKSNPNSRINLEKEYFELHDLQLDYVKFKLKESNQLIKTNQDLIIFLQLKFKEFYYLPTTRNMKYLTNHIEYHMINGKMIDKLKNLLSNYDWIMFRIKNKELNELIKCFNYINNDIEFKLIQRTLKMSYHQILLCSSDNNVSFQLYGRLFSQKNNSNYIYKNHY